MLVVTARQMAEIDRETIAGGVPGSELMERAGREIVRCLLDLFPDLAPPGRIAICCGKGNNGGDGLVMARLLESLGFQVSVMLLALPEDLSPDARMNHDRLPVGVDVLHAPPQEWAVRWHELCGGMDLVVDAVFGTGITPPVREPYVSLFEVFNEQLVPTLALDIPSGVCGNSGKVDPVAVQADSTITVGLVKHGLLLPPGRDYVGDLKVVDIGFADEVIQRHVHDHHYWPVAEYVSLLPHRASDVHKYRCGTLLILAGSRAYGGAAVLAGLGGLRSGAGLVTVGLPQSLEIPARIGLPEALIVSLPETASGTLAPLVPDQVENLLEKKHALAVGPGMSGDPATDQFIVDFLTTSDLPLVLDADGLSAFARTGNEPRFATQDVVLTPHAGELARLVGLRPAEVQQRAWELVPQLAQRWGVTLLLKGSPTLIGTPDGALSFNPTGDDALAHGGTGDVLTGLIGGLLAQGCCASDAALLGAYLHGKAGEMAAFDSSRRSVLAREVADKIGEAFAVLEDFQLMTSSDQPREQV